MIERPNNHLWLIVVIVVLVIANLVWWFAHRDTQNTSMKAYCAQFSSQQEAQDYMKAHNATYLDGDSDGSACEALP